MALTNYMKKINLIKHSHGLVFLIQVFAGQKISEQKFKCFITNLDRNFYFKLYQNYIFKDFKNITLQSLKALLILFPTELKVGYLYFYTHAHTYICIYTSLR